MTRLLRRLLRRRSADTGRMSLGAGAAVCFTGLFALVTGVQVIDTYNVGTAGGGFRSGDIPYHADDIPPGSLVGCGTAGQVTELTCNAYRTVLANYPEFDRPGWRGCYRPGPPDHGTGQACDFMTNVDRSAGTAEQNALGFELSRWLMRNHEQIGVKYLIWHQRIWNPNPGFEDPLCVDETTPESFARSCWRQMENRGSNTENHYDHVHVSFLR
ncbi:hypothetical protein NI17_017215 [Thermobifida halotolerans]|uniref:ARB-07466-like C-terminal domain-containing protein n=1 Tax=Thermobifida halotolerans TaxID=483545 RepID=A0AA97LV20_9ACTN|nr:hypothetical protein [Thermobifida halotolerans]UOE18545.1 hypothetical protein NI17_017215 [Thermobifida halotolerans]